MGDPSKVETYCNLLKDKIDFLAQDRVQRYFPESYDFLSESLPEAAFAPTMMCY